MTIEAVIARSGALAATRRRAARRTGGVNPVVGHAIMIAMSIFAIFPVYWMLVTSLRPENQIFDTALWPDAAALNNYAYALNAIPIWRMLANTLIISATVTAIQLFTGIVVAYGFARWRFRFDKFVYVLIALTWLVPIQVVMIPNYLLVANLGLLDSVIALILPHFASAFAIMLLTQSIRAFPKEVLEASRMDGSRSWRTLWEIVVPNLRGMIASLAILIFISTWNEYFWPLLLSRSAENTVIQIGIQMFITQEGTQWGPLMAASTMASLPILALYVVLQRQVIQSFMKSGLR